MIHILRFIILFAIPLECFAQLAPLQHVPSVGNAFWTEHRDYAWIHRGLQLSLKKDGTLFVDGYARVRIPKWAGPFPSAIISNLAAGEIEGELLIAYTADMGGEGNSFVCRFARDLKSIRWCQMTMFNFSVFTGNDAIWVGAIGFIGRLDPKRGKYIWRQPMLYGAYSASGDSFNVTCPVAEDEATVTFESEGSNRGTEKQIVLNRASGQIVSVTDIAGNRVCQ